MEIQFYDLKSRQKVGIPAGRIRKVTFERQNKDGSTTIRYGFRAEHDGRELTTFASKADWDALDEQATRDTEKLQRRPEAEQADAEVAQAAAAPSQASRQEPEQVPVERQPDVGRPASPEPRLQETPNPASRVSPSAPPETQSTPRHDSLARYRRLLGDERASEIERRAAVLSREYDLVSQDEQSLRAEHERLGHQLSDLDAAAAMEVRRIEHAKGVAKARLRAFRGQGAQDQDEAKRLSLRAEKIDVQRHSEEKFERLAEAREHEQAADAADVRVVNMRNRIRALGRREQTLVDEGRHPRPWLARHFNDVSLQVAIEGDLRRREQERTRASEHDGRSTEPGAEHPQRVERPAEKGARVVEPPARELAGAGGGIEL